MKIIFEGIFGKIERSNPASAYSRIKSSINILILKRGIDKDMVKMDLNVPRGTFRSRRQCEDRQSI